jgi:hypothetical protein
MRKPRLGSGARFAGLTRSLKRKGHSASSARAIAASIGRKKYGSARMAKMARAGRKRAARARR